MKRDRLGELTLKEREQLQRESHALYMKEWRQKKAEREKTELDILIDAFNYPLNKDFPDECVKFRLMVLGHIKREPFFYNSHLNKSTKGRISCKSCRAYCKCFEWFKDNKPIEGCKIW